LEITMRLLAAVVATAVLSLTAIVSARAQGPDTTQAGVLECDISAGIGLIIASKKDVTCLFKPVNNAPQEVYTGTITKIGVDLGATGGGQMIWSVFAPTSRPFGALAGTYAGATAEATLGAGVGANVLVGGSNRTITLQPLSVQGQLGLNIAAGVAELKLRSVQ
jgi:hypothetical protein